MLHCPGAPSHWLNFALGLALSCAVGWRDGGWTNHDAQVTNFCFLFSNGFTQRPRDLLQTTMTAHALNRGAQRRVRLTEVYPRLRYCGHLRRTRLAAADSCSSQ